MFWSRRYPTKPYGIECIQCRYESLRCVPYWERKFCTTVGSVPWRKLVETKKYMSLYKNIVEWNDSAGEEAFNNAKNRFWAEMNGLIPSSDISLPDPDMYIDDIDWSSSCNNIDPQLILDLEKSKKPKPSDDREAETLGNDREFVILGLYPIYLNPTTLPCSGRGDEFEEEILKNKENNVLENYGKNVVDDKKNPWKSACVGQSKAAAIGGAWNTNTTWNNNNSRYKTSTRSRFRGGYNDHKFGGWWWNNGGRRRNRYSVQIRYENLASCY
ncbi:hypothetical protein D8674_002382 [Pyrus ussuriensis x Pyrus communis]|uniref:Uncharacterized protein n=1 Tax=Pyrus ussuriensis x Pyrus communis TaxID=2448454 RepID=A0A5N5FEI8_9ROSA|nr:hypothetical protein D8674_002382 [Pyrus ussuriensis x Pyrus communis]